MTGFQLTARVKRSAELAPRPCGPPSFSNSSRLRSCRCRTSAPLEKARPLPLMIATSASGSRSKRCSAASSPSTTSSLTAFSLSGRLSVIVAIRSAQEYSTRLLSSVATIFPPQRNCPEPGGSGQLAGAERGCQRQPRRSMEDAEYPQQKDYRDRDPEQPKQHTAHVYSPISFGSIGYFLLPRISRAASMSRSPVIWPTFSLTAPVALRMPPLMRSLSITQYSAGFACCKRTSSSLA